MPGTLSHILVMLRILRAALGTHATLHEDVVCGNIEHNACDVEGIGHATRRLGRIDVLGWRILGDVHELPAHILARPLIEVDGHVVIGQIRIVDTVGRDTVLARPFATLLEDLVETVGKLLRAYVVDGELPVTHAHLCSTGCVTAQVEERDVAGSGTVHAAIAPRALHA